MKILVTGAKGFVGKNFVWELKNKEYTDVFEYDIDTNPDLLDVYTKSCDFVFHLAGVNRPKNQEDFMKGNFGFTTTLLDSLIKNNNKAPILITSSIHADKDNPYGISKRAGEDAIFNYGKEHSVKVLVYRLQNLFGKWCRPNYNSAVATFCHNIANGLDITINNEKTIVPLVYIDDLMDELFNALNKEENRGEKFCFVSENYNVSLGRISKLLYSFKNSRGSLEVADMSDGFSKKLYSTYLSYFPKEELSYPLDMKTDERGFFAEFIKTPDRGQVSINLSKPGITKGNHWHHTKNEKFLVVSGEGIIAFRNINNDEKIEYPVSGKKLMVIDVPPGYTHSIRNTGKSDLVTVIWVNEVFNVNKPDTYYLEV